MITQIHNPRFTIRTSERRRGNSSLRTSSCLRIFTSAVFRNRCPTFVDCSTSFDRRSTLNVVSVCVVCSTMTRAWTTASTIVAAVAAEEPIDHRLDDFDEM